MFRRDNLAVIAVAVVVAATAWLFGGARGDWLRPVAPWLVALLVGTVFCWPQRHPGESACAARARVRAELWRSKLVWLACVFLVLLAVPFVNVGLCPVCDAAQIAQGADPRAPYTFLPFCVCRMSHLGVVLWFAIVLPSVVAVRHALTDAGRRFTLELIVWNGVALAALGFVQDALGATGPFWSNPSGGERPVCFFSTFGYSNMAGTYFAMLFGLAVALWYDGCERCCRRPSLLMAAGIFFFAALDTRSRAAFLFLTATALIFFALTFIRLFSQTPRHCRVATGACGLVVFGLCVAITAIVMPKDLRAEVRQLDVSKVICRLTGRNQYHVRVASEIWKDHPLFGCGGWGYAYLCAPKMKELGMNLDSLQKTGGINVHNDHLQFLAEHGIVGFGFLVAIVLLLVKPMAGRHPSISVLFVLVTAVGTVLCALGDCPLRSCAVLALFFVSLASITGFGS